MKFFGSKRHEHAGEGQHLERKPSPDTDGRITFRACFMGLVASVSFQHHNKLSQWNETN